MRADACRRLALAAVVVVLLAGCSQATYQRSAAASGTVLATLGDQFVAAGEDYKRLRAAGVLTDAEYEQWKTFAERFKVGYDAAAAAWLAAVDAGSVRAAAIQVSRLTTDLYLYVLVASKRRQGVPVAIPAPPPTGLPPSQ